MPRRFAARPVLLTKILFPIHPSTYKFTIKQILLNQHIAHRKQHRRLASRPSRKPVIGLEAVFERRVSITHTFAPSILPSIIRCACGLK